ncbi:transcription-repair coupling factor [Jonesia quinghaiensis]|uniref:transcription-repair coupling factor n=1 Tax=Jonesia quinghaiensis TaxID=262806 RepID=UPI00040A3FCF|nr:transcription-repair coupling factor [Jonesia quinghaiensis]
MNLSGILPVLQRDSAVEKSLELARSGAPAKIIASPGVRPPLLAAVSQALREVNAARASAGQDQPRTVIVVTATGREADELAAALRCYLPADSVATLPAWETLPHERLSPRSDTVARRLAVFRRLAHPTADGITGTIEVLTMPVRALLQPVVQGLGDLAPVRLRTGDDADLTQVATELAQAAYARVDMVERRGEFAVRGGILDVFPPHESHPLRIEFFGDEVDEIRYFAVADQRSLDEASDGLWAPPCRELLLTDDIRQRAHALAAQVPGAAEMLEKMAQGIAVEGMESLTPALVDQMIPVMDLFPDNVMVVVNEPERVRRRAHDLVQTTQEFLAAAWTSAAAGGNTPIDLSAASFLTIEQVRHLGEQRGLTWWNIAAFGLGESPAGDGYDDTPTGPGGVPQSGPVPDFDDDASTIVRITTRDVQAYRGELDRALDDVKGLQSAGWLLILTTEGHGPAQRLVEQLAALDVTARLGDDLTQEPESGIVHVVPAPVGPGFVAPDLKLAVFSENDLTGRSGATTRDMRKMPSRRRNVVDPLQLRAGDFVVHEQHGVGKFVELVQRTLGAPGNQATREYLVIEYAASRKGQPGDRLFVPMDQLDQVTKYTGGESPSVNKMGGTDWQKTKAKARKAIKQIAGELIRLYSARMATKGFAFSPDTPWQRELEDAFAYIETPDQLATIDEVKADMEKSIPMDRLICGDVGYGKTEIAVRAAFKAVQDGKQVAILVPTTLLVQQHYDTFSERYSGFPVVVKALSRFQSEKDSKEIIKGLSEGSVDVVIGTHRLLSGSVHFKELGLVVIDEEQRFGVEHKETLKQLRTNVDVLAMSATPIPRTLEMAVTGIREMSTLATPPEERHPVLTYVGAAEDKQITAAIRRELLREGQVFFVHNKVETIESTASRLMELVPEARVRVAHGKMNEHELEQVILDFWEKRFDVLVSTTIIETGLDVSNANTLIVERSDVMGLSQLHQLRGRVGRGRERAYAYFFFPPDKPLTETAHERLQTIAANTDLGSGMRVAMKDLEIRGAGNLLGGEQSGHIAGVGFDLYMRMVGEAVADFRGESPEETPEVQIELPIDAHLPHDYVAHERLRLEAYRKIAAATTPSQLDDVRGELVDRYGHLPVEVANLFEVATFRNEVRDIGLRDVTVQGKFVRFAPLELPESATLKLKRLYPGSMIKPVVRTVLVPYPTTARIGGAPLRGVDLIEWARKFIDTIVKPTLDPPA